MLTGGALLGLLVYVLLGAWLLRGGNRRPG